MADKSLVPPPPPQPMIASGAPAGGNPFDALFEDSTPAQQPAHNPFDTLFTQGSGGQANAPAKAPAKPLKLAPPAPAPIQPAPINGGTSTAPIKPPAHPQVQPPPPAPSLWQTAGADALNGLDAFSAGILDAIQHLPGGFGRMGQQAVTQAKQRAAEEKRYDPASKVAATLAGIPHGPLQLAQDVYNGAIAAPAHLPPASFADQYAQLPGVRVLANEMPGTFGTASAGGGMAVPIGAGGALKTLKFLPAAAAEVGGAGAVGGGLGYAGSAGQQYKDTGKVNQQQAVEDAIANAAMATGGAGIVHGAGKLFAGHEAPVEAAPEAEKAAPAEEAKPEEKPTEKPKPQAPVRNTPRKKYDFIKPEIKEKLEAQDEALKAQPPAEEAPAATDLLKELAKPEPPMPVDQKLLDGLKEGLEETQKVPENWQPERQPEAPAAKPEPAPAVEKEPEVQATFRDAEGKPHTQSLGAEQKPEPVPAAAEPAKRPYFENGEIPSSRKIVHDLDNYYVAKDGSTYEVYEKGNDLNPLSRSKHRAQAIDSAEKRQAGTFQGNRGKRNDLLNLKDSTSYQRSVDATAKPTGDADLQPRLKEIAAAKANYDQARADYRAVHDAVRQGTGFSLKTDKVRKLSPEAEQIIANARADEKVGPDQFGVEVNADRLPKAAKYVPAKGADIEADLRQRYEAMQQAKAKFDEVKAQHVPDIIEKRAQFQSNAIKVPHEGRNYNIKFTAKPKSELAGKLPAQEFAQGETEPAHNHRETLKAIQTAKDNGVWDAVAKKLQGEVHGGDPITAAVSTAIKLKEALDERGVRLDANELVHWLGNANTSDIYEHRAEPEFFHEYKNARGALDLALQGVEPLRTAEEKHAWMSNRYSEPEAIRSGENGADKLTPAQREGLIKQNEALDNLSDLFEQYGEHLRQEGYTDEWPRSLVGKNAVLSALERDLKGLDPRRHDAKNWLDKAANTVTRGLYDMYVTGNWGIHQLHLLEGLTVGPSYDPGAFGEAVNHLATAKEARDFADSFESSSGNMKRIKEDNDSLIAEKWRALQKRVADTAGKAVGVDNASDKLAHNKTAQAIGDVVEGSILEQKKLALARVMGAVKAAKEMAYEGGAKQLMRDMMGDQMDPEAKLEAAGKIAYHMNQMVGYSPAGYSDLNVFGRLGRTKYGTFAKWFTPFTTTRLQQARVLTKFFGQAANAIGRGDYKTGSARAAQGMMLLGLITAVGGRAGVPREFQDLLRKLDPKTAKDFLENMDKWNMLAHADKEVAHVTPQLMAYSYLGDSFPVQLINALTNATSKPLGSDSQARGALTIAAGLGVSSIADRMGFNTILKIAKALKEGAAGSRTQFAFKESPTPQTAAKGMVAAQKLLKLAGVHVEPGKVNDFLGKEQVPANIPERLFHALTAGESMSAAHVINMYRDDAAFKDKLYELDPKFVERMDRMNRKIGKAADNAHDPAIQEGMRQRLRGFWEHAFEQYMQQHQQPESAAKGTEA